MSDLTLIRVGFLGVRFDMGFKITTPPSQSKTLKFYQKLEIWYVSIHTCVVSENIPFITKTCLILLMSAFFAKNHHFLSKIVPLLKVTV